MAVSEVVSRSDLFSIEQLAFRETTNVMAAAHIPVVDLPGYRVRLASAIMRLPTPVAKAVLAPRIARARGGKPPSMLGDRLKGKRQTESAYLNGAVAASGTRLGVATPINRGLDELVRRVTESDRERETFRGDPARMLEFLHGQGEGLSE
jgi:ketopantoate reductase